MEIGLDQSCKITARKWVDSKLHVTTRASSKRIFSREDECRPRGDKLFPIRRLGVSKKLMGSKTPGSRQTPFSVVRN